MRDSRMLRELFQHVSQALDTYVPEGSLFAGFDEETLYVFRNQIDRNMATLTETCASRLRSESTDA